MRIRAATIADIPLLRSLADRIWREYYPAIISVEQIDFMLGQMYSEEQLSRELATDVAWEVVEFEGGAIGFQSYELQPDGRVKLHKLYLLPEFHGRGFGQQMLAHVFAQAKKLGGH